MDNNLKLKQSNNLILATHRMNVNQMRIFFYVCSHYQGDLNVSLNFDDINRILNPNRGTVQKETLLSNIDTMMSNAFIDLKLNDEDDEYCKAPVFILARKKKNSKNMDFEFNPHVAKELEELRGYTWMYLSNLTGMSSTYSVRLYEFFAMRLGSQKKKDKFIFEIKKLRLYLNCTDKYSLFKNFEAKVLKQAEKEINSKTNVSMSYQKIKQGRSISSIEFTFEWKSHKKNEDIIENSIDYEEMDQLLNELKEGRL